MPTYHVYVDLNARQLGVSTVNPPVTGGTAIDSFQHAVAPHTALLAVANQRNSPMRFEYSSGGSWQPGSESFEATSIGLDEALGYGGALAKLNTSVRLVSALGYVIKTW